MMMNERQVQAQINMLIQQRDNALNQVVNLMGELGIKAQLIEDLEAKVAAATSLAEATLGPSEIAPSGPAA